MVDVLTHNTPKARKEHKCSHCQATIKKGEVYDNQVYVDGDLYTFKSHINCQELAMKIMRDNYHYYDEGITLCEEELETLLYYAKSYQQVLKRLFGMWEIYDLIRESRK